MSASALRRPMTLDEFLEWEERQEERWEFDGVGPVPWGDGFDAQGMTGGTRAHSAISHALHRSVGGRLPRPGPCRYHGADLKFVTASGKARYPDGFVACRRGGRGDTVEREPVVVFEVLSASTAATDRTEKAREYRDTPSVRRYVMLEQDAVAATVHAREPDGRWTVHLLSGGDVLDLPEVGAAFPLAELYEEVDFRDDQGRPASGGEG